MPPPTTSTSSSAEAIACSDFARWKGPRSLAMLMPPLSHSRGERTALLDDDLDPLELLELGVTGRRHGAPERADDVHGAVGDPRGTEEDLLERPDAADLHPLAAWQ